MQRTARRGTTRRSRSSISMDSGYKKGASAYNIACGYALKGDRDEAFAWLKKAAQFGFEVYPFAKTDDDFDGVHDDARWRELPRLARQWEAEGDKVRGEEAARRYADVIANPATTGEDLYDIGMELHKAGRTRRLRRGGRRPKHYRPSTSLQHRLRVLARRGMDARSVPAQERRGGLLNVDAIAREDETWTASGRTRASPRSFRWPRSWSSRRGRKYKGKTSSGIGTQRRLDESAKEYETLRHATRRSAAPGSISALRSSRPATRATAIRPSTRRSISTTGSRPRCTTSPARTRRTPEGPGIQLALQVDGRRVQLSRDAAQRRGPGQLARRSAL